MIIFSCSNGRDYSGVFQLRGGGCSSPYIELRKVKGFGKKYYIVTLYEENYKDSQGAEFLGVIEDNVISVKNGTVVIHGDSIEVIAGSKKCLYEKIK